MKKSLLLSVLVIGILLMGAVAYASADSVTVTKSGAGVQTATDTVTVTAAVRSKLELTVVTPNNTQTVDFGTVEPGTPANATVNLTVKSNRTYNLTTAISGQNALMNLTTSVGNVPGEPVTASKAYTDTYNVNVPWTTAPGNYTASVLYTVTQF
jgi:hypothetical protein